MPLLLLGTGSPAALLDARAASLLRAGIVCAAGSAIDVEAVSLKIWAPVALPAASASAEPTGAAAELADIAANADLVEATEEQRAALCAAVAAGPAPRPSMLPAPTARRSSLLLVVSFNVSASMTRSDDASAVSDASAPSYLVAGRHYTLEAVASWALARAADLAATADGSSSRRATAVDGAGSATSTSGGLQPSTSPALAVSSLDLAALRALVPLLAALRPHFLRTPSLLSHAGSFNATAVVAAVDRTPVVSASIAYAALGPWLQALAAAEGGSYDVYVAVSDQGPLLEPLPEGPEPGTSAADNDSFPLIPGIATIGAALVVGIATFLALSVRRRRRKQVVVAPQGELGDAAGEESAQRAVNPAWAASHFRTLRQPARRTLDLAESSLAPTLRQPGRRTLDLASAAAAITAASLPSGAEADADDVNGGADAATRSRKRSLGDDRDAADSDTDANADATGVGSGSSDDDHGDEGAGDATPDADVGVGGHVPVANSDEDATEHSRVLSQPLTRGKSRGAGSGRSWSSLKTMRAEVGSNAAGDGTTGTDGDGSTLPRSRSFIVEVGAMLSRGASYLRGLASRQNSYLALDVANPDDAGAAAAGPDGGSSTHTGGRWLSPGRRGSGAKRSSSRSASLSASRSASCMHAASAASAASGEAPAPPLRGAASRGGGSGGGEVHKSLSGDAASWASRSGSTTPSLLLGSRASSAASVFEVDMARIQDWDAAAAPSAGIGEWGASPSSSGRRHGSGSRTVPRNASVPQALATLDKGRSSGDSAPSDLLNSSGLGLQKAGSFGYGPRSVSSGSAAAALSKRAASPSTSAQDRARRAASAAIELNEGAASASTPAAAAAAAVAAPARSFGSLPMRIARQYAAAAPPRVVSAPSAAAAAATAATAPGIARIARLVTPPAVIAEAEDEYAGEATPMTEAEIEDLARSLASPALSRIRSALSAPDSRYG